MGLPYPVLSSMDVAAILARRCFLGTGIALVSIESVYHLCISLMESQVACSQRSR